MLLALLGTVTGVTWRSQRGWSHRPFLIRGDLDATSCWDGTGTQRWSKAVLPGCLVGSGMSACCQLDLRRKNQLLSLPAPACLCSCWGLKCPGWGAASAGTWFVLVARCHYWLWDVASATRRPDANTDSRRQQSPRSPLVTALIAACWHLEVWFSSYRNQSGAESTGSWKSGGNPSSLAMSLQVLSPLSPPVLLNIPPL